MKHVAYYRVSTQKQGQSGLGLEAQETSVRDYLSRTGGELVASFTEVESGKVSDRPQLTAALRECKRQKARLVIAKLDRLSRNLAFLAQLMQDRVDFVACDNPHATRTLLGMLAVFAEHEAREISDRTKKALAAAKARGVKLGGFRGYVPPPGAARAAARKRNAEAINVAEEAVKLGRVDGPCALARYLTQAGVLTAKGGTQWRAVQAKRIMRMLPA